MKLTIITINYNNLKGLMKTAESVINQIWRDFEWIIVDGGSTDGSKEYIEQLAKQLEEGKDQPAPWTVEQFSLLGFTAADLKGVSEETPNSPSSILHQPSSIDYPPSSILHPRQRLFWCSEPDKGIYNAMNKGIMKAQGEYLNFMNSGDYYYEKDILEKVTVKFDYSNVDLLIGLAQYSDTGKLLFEPIQKEDIYKHLLIFSLSHQAGFIRNEIARKYPYDESLRIVSDWKFYIQAINMSHSRIVLLDDVIVSMQPNGVSGKNIQKRIDERDKVIKDYYGKGVSDLIQDYNSLRSNEIIVKTNILLKNDVKLYRLVRRFLAAIIYFYEFKKRFVRNS